MEPRCEICQCSRIGSQGFGRGELRRNGRRTGTLRYESNEQRRTNTAWVDQNSESIRLVNVVYSESKKASSWIDRWGDGKRHCSRLGSKNNHATTIDNNCTDGCFVFPTCFGTSQSCSIQSAGTHTIGYGWKRWEGVHYRLGGAKICTIFALCQRQPTKIPNYVRDLEHPSCTHCGKRSERRHREYLGHQEPKSLVRYPSRRSGHIRHSVESNTRLPFAYGIERRSQPCHQTLGFEILDEYATCYIDWSQSRNSQHVVVPS
mmetsp:Transcript_26772/g.73661  ORF Transcript_26772/g.73661 Transcript_26772/m.73661 type:complete len:261 (-) Transcript_26772:2296-3078(-)